MRILHCLFAAIALAMACPVAAQPGVGQTIRLIAPFPPGGSVDIIARLIAEPLGSHLGSRIVIDNRSGASGNIGMEAAARAKPDGQTIVLNTIPLVTNQSLFDKLPWDPISDFAPIGEFDGRRDVGAIFRTVPTNVFLVKATYWIGK